MRPAKGTEALPTLTLAAANETAFTTGGGAMRRMDGSPRRQMTHFRLCALMHRCAEVLPHW